jgi:hypothetical protein
VRNVRGLAVLALLAAAAPRASRAAGGDDEETPASQPAPAEPAGPPAPAAAPREVVGVAGSAAAPLVVLGDGAVLARDGEGWRPAGRGGVGATLTWARGDAAGAPWAVGASPPAYWFDGATWQAEPVRRNGTSVLSITGPIAMTAGRRVFVRGPKGWKELPRTAEPATSVWSDGLAAAAVLPQAGLMVLDRGGWKAVKTPGAARLVGGAGKDVFVVLADGTVARVAATGATRVPTDRALAGFTAELACAAPGGKLVLVGRGGAGTLVIARVERGRVVRVDQTTFPTAEPLAGAVADGKGAIVVASRAGTIATRDAQGAWTQTTIAAPSAATAAATAPNPPARVGP